jgi:hypothetical protein
MAHKPNRFFPMSSSTESIVLSTRLKFRGGVRYKHKNPRLVGRKKVLSEGFSSYSYSHDLGKLVSHERLIDRENNRYFEVVKEIETNQIIHKCDEELKAHIGHGTARRHTT